MKKYYKVIIFILIIILITLNILQTSTILKLFREIKWTKIQPVNLYKYQFDNSISDFKQDKIKIVFFGDSRIANWKPLPSFKNCVLINRGIGGETTAQSLLRIADDVLSIKPEIVIIQVGINDMTAIGLFPGNREFIVNNCLNNILKQINILTSKNITVVLLTIFPVGEISLLRKITWSNKTLDEINRINRKLMNINSPKVTVINCDRILSDKNFRLISSYSANTLHLNEHGYMAINKYIDPIIKIIISRLKK